MEIVLESAFRNGTIFEDDTPEQVPEYSAGKV
jgi:hypothetical protein